MPSKPGLHIEKIEKLGDIEWLELGQPAGRSWNAALLVAPELRGAFLFGEGVHGYAKPDGRYMDDLWLYDINGHRWVCCYPGADTKTLELTIDRDGFEATKDGERLPVPSQVHSYSMNTCDTDRKRFLSRPNLHDYWKKALPSRQKWLKPAPTDVSPWLFETSSGRWNRLRTGTTAPKSGYGDTLIYLPSRKQAFFAHRNEEVWFYDMAKDSWKRAKPEGKPCQGSNTYATLNALMAFDPVNNMVLLVMHSYHYGKPDRLGIYVYDPETNAWVEEPLALPEKLRNTQVKNGFYDAELNAVTLHCAGDSQDDGVIWAYRFKNKR